MLVREDQKIYPVGFPTSTNTFSCFMRLSRLIMGQDTRQNVALTEVAIHGIMTISEEDWHKCGETEM